MGLKTIIGAMVLLLALCACKTVTLNYEGYLHSQVQNWQPLPAPLIASLQTFYAFDLKDVRYAEGVNLQLDFDAVTFQERIYFKKQKIDFKDKLELKLLAHELEHTQQYLKNPFFLEKYLVTALKKALAGKGQGGHIASIHDEIAFEQQATAKALQVYQAFRHTPLKN